MVAKDGSHEAIVFNLVPTAGILQAELMKVKTDLLKHNFFSLYKKCNKKNHLKFCFTVL